MKNDKNVDLRRTTENSKKAEAFYQLMSQLLDFGEVYYKTEGDLSLKQTKNHVILEYLDGTAVRSDLKAFVANNNIKVIESTARQELIKMFNELKPLIDQQLGQGLAKYEPRILEYIVQVVEEDERLKSFQNKIPEQILDDLVADIYQYLLKLDFENIRLNQELRYSLSHYAQQDLKDKILRKLAKIKSTVLKKNHLKLEKELKNTYLTIIRRLLLKYSDLEYHIEDYHFNMTITDYVVVIRYDFNIKSRVLDVDDLRVTNRLDSNGRIHVLAFNKTALTEDFKSKVNSLDYVLNYKYNNFE